MCYRKTCYTPKSKYTECSEGDSGLVRNAKTEYRERGVIQMTQLTNRCSVMHSKVAGMVTGAYAMMNTALMLAYAAEDNPFEPAQETITDIVEQLKDTLLAIVVPLATCAFVFCLIMMFVSQNQKKVEAYRSWAITIVICVVVIFAATFIFDQAELIGKSFNPAE